MVMASQGEVATTPRQNATHRTRHPLVINLGVGRTGTLSLHSFFACSGWISRHNMGCGGPAESSLEGSRCYRKIEDFLEMLPYQEEPRGHEHLFRRVLGIGDAFTEISDSYKCIFPQVTQLHLLMSALPSACWLLTTRPTKHWLASVRNFNLNLTLDRTNTKTQRWRNMMAQMLEHCPISPRNESGLAAWYEGHLARATEAMSRARCALVLETESPEAPMQLAARFPGTRQSCWGNEHIDG